MGPNVLQHSVIIIIVIFNLYALHVFRKCGIIAALIITGNDSERSDNDVL